MTDQRDVIPPSKHRLSAMTSGELLQRRRELEHARKGISDAAPIQAELARLLDEISAEEAERASIAQATPRYPRVGGV